MICISQIIPERREIRPTADRGPILLCVDTSGSMRGPREVVAKALALECMRAAKAQERGCFVFAFAGPQEVISFRQIWQCSRCCISTAWHAASCTTRRPCL